MLKKRMTIKLFVLIMPIWNYNWFQVIIIIIIIIIIITIINYLKPNNLFEKGELQH